MYHCVQVGGTTGKTFFSQQSEKQKKKKGRSGVRVQDRVVSVGIF